MAVLPSSGPISTTQIMTDGLGVPVQARSWPSMWALASPGTIPKNKANQGGPYVLPNDWYGYSNSAPQTHYIMPGNVYGNIILGITHTDFNYARNTGSAIFFDTTGGEIVYYHNEVTLDYGFNRLYLSFDTTPIVDGVRSVGLRIYIDDYFYVTGYFGKTSNWVVVKTFQQRAPNYVWQISDFASAINPSSIPITAPILFSSGMKHYIDLPFNPAGIDACIVNNTLSMGMLQYDNDKLGIASTGANTSSGMEIDCTKVSLYYTI